MAKRPTSQSTSSAGGDGNPPEGGFDQPTGDGNSGSQGSDPQDQDGFDAPSESEVGGDEAAMESAAVEAEMGSDIVALKSEIERKLAGQASAATESASVQDVGGSNIVGVGYGHGDFESLASDLAQNLTPGGGGLVVFTVERTANEELVSEIASVAGTSALSTVPIVQVPVGVVDAYPHRMRMRPAPGGISVAHSLVTAGTLGCLVRGLTAPRDRRLMILSNNHVLANSNNARLGDCICQPGPYDGGRCPQDQIAILESFVRINFAGGINYVDCATGWAWPDRVRRELMYLSGSTPNFFRVGAVPIAPAVGMLVGKTGRTTQLKAGRVTAVNVAVNVNYGAGRVAHFRDQISIVGTTSAGFSAGGDSGSLVWGWQAGLPPVGLLFAGGGGTTFANRFPRVLSALQVRMYN